ncbi:MAG: hypothetical protein Q4D02_08080 [Clostridia bacterium]|nr:hypothetical protein [Clostridia bacterium]
MLNIYEGTLNSDQAMDSALRFRDVNITEVAMMRYVEVALLYLKATYTGQELQDKIYDLRLEVNYVFSEFDLNGIIASKTYSELSRELEG